MRARAVVAVAYVGGVAALAVHGVTAEVPGPLVTAAVLTLPASVVAVPGYYLAYGFLALVTGANSDTATGWCSSDGTCHATGEPAAWFLVTTGALLVAVLVAAAVADVALVWWLRSRSGAAGRRTAGAPR